MYIISKNRKKIEMIDDLGFMIFCKKNNFEKEEEEQKEEEGEEEEEEEKEEEKSTDLWDK